MEGANSVAVPNASAETTVNASLVEEDEETERKNEDRRATNFLPAAPSAVGPGAEKNNSLVMGKQIGRGSYRMERDVHRRSDRSAVRIHQTLKRFLEFDLRLSSSASRIGKTLRPLRNASAGRVAQAQRCTSPKKHYKTPSRLSCFSGRVVLVLPPPAEKESGRITQRDFARLPFHLGREGEQFERTSTTFTRTYISAKTLSSFHRADVIQIFVNVQIQSKRPTNE